MRSMSGSVVFPFSDMVKDTIDTHGYDWAYHYYVFQNDLPVWQFRIFAGV